MPEPLWISKKIALAIHERQLVEHGGIPGLRNEGALESALARAKNLFHYGDETADLASMAAAYVYGLASNHPFYDGNKRIALVVSLSFLLLNGKKLVASREERYTAFLGLASGELGENALAEWFRANLEDDLEGS